MNTSTDARSMAYATKAAKAIRRRLLRLADQMEKQDEIWVSFTDVCVLNRVVEMTLTGTFQDPFAGGAAFNVTRMAVSSEMLRNWLT